jgi:hypothetical protein
VLGVVVNILSAWSHVRLIHRLKRGGPPSGRASTLGLAVAVILAVLGLSMATYLIWVRDPVRPHPEKSEDQPLPGKPGVLPTRAWAKPGEGRVPPTPSPSFSRNVIMGHQLVDADWNRFKPTNAVNRNHAGWTRLGSRVIKGAQPQREIVVFRRCHRA